MLDMKTRTNLPPAFHRFWAAAGISSLGDGIRLSALPLLGATLTDDPTVLSLLTAAALLPWLLFGVLGGALVDRWDRRSTMWIADLARATLLAFAAVAGLAGRLSIPVLLVVAFLLGIGQLMFDTAAQSYVPQLLGRDHDVMQRANSRLRGTQQVADGFLGPPAGSALFILGRTVPFVADAISFAVSAVLVRALPVLPVKRDGPRGSLLADARDGATYLFRDRLLLGLAIRPAIGNVAFMAGEAVLVLFARDRLHLDAAGYGLLLSCQAVGGVLGTLLAGRLSRHLGIGGALTLTAATEAVAQLALAFSDHALVAGAVLAVTGAAISATMVLGPSIRQTIVPEHLMGRVSAASRLMAVSGGPLGAVIGGVLASAFGLRVPFVFGAVLLGSMTLITLPMVTNRRIEAALAAARAPERAVPHRPEDDVDA
ncbi:MFS transporter [Actinoplanes regularis]|uniref:MFS transporter n=1 Tax=Actinoplanes regularis TaxID=52697 RepID=UPI0024A35A00|nr:MFS transporter [Actinoplanes regularis]GLW35830.1 MFS transporter [Actinoplanes regularis]